MFCKLVHDRFGRDQQEILVRQLFHIKQSGTVADYVEEFSQLVDQLSSYTTTTDPLYYTLRFIDGLRDDIKSVVLVQRPADLDTGCVLAALQEEVGDYYRRRDYKKHEPGFSSKTSSKNLLLLPAPPVRDKQHALGVADDRRGVESARAVTSPEAKVAALRSYPRALGLCYKCNEKWTKEHRCAPTVQLHAVQHLWELFQLDDDSDESYGPDRHVATENHVFLAISKSAVSGSSAARTIKLWGTIQRHRVSILIDSGSTSSFISAAVAQQLAHVTYLPVLTVVQVAGGGILQCIAVIQRAEWSVQSHIFQTDLRVLPLTTYDVIIVMDWLEAHSPMRVHWKEKWLQLPHQGSQVLLQGELPDSPERVLLQLCCDSGRDSGLSNLLATL
jgi:hypothetical protein